MTNELYCEMHAFYVCDVKGLPVHRTSVSLRGHLYTVHLCR